MELNWIEKSDEMNVGVCERDLEEDVIISNMERYNIMKQPEHRKSY